MRVADNVLGYAADEQMSQSRPSVRGNDDQIDVFVRRMANLHSWRTAKDRNRISRLGFRCHRAHLLLRRCLRFAQELSRIELRVLVSERERVRINYMHQAQFRTEVTGELKSVLKRDL